MCLKTEYAYSLNPLFHTLLLLGVVYSQFTYSQNWTDIFVENNLWNFHMPKWNMCVVGFESGSTGLHVLTWLCSRELLDETGEVTLTSSWKEIKKLVKDDPRYSKFSSSDRVMYCNGLNISRDFLLSCYFLY